jgi:hypothetical protein
VFTPLRAALAAALALPFLSAVLPAALEAAGLQSAWSASQRGQQCSETHALPSIRPLAPLCVERLVSVNSRGLGVEGWGEKNVGMSRDVVGGFSNLVDGG